MKKKQIELVKDNYDKNITYKVINAKYNDAIKNKYYLEALMISYALVEDRLRSFLYFLGLIETNENNKLYICDKNEDIIELLKIKNRDFNKYEFNDISSKYGAIARITKWVNSSKCIKKKKSYLYILNYECESLDIDGILESVSKMKKWIDFRNEITHGLLNKNVDSLYKELEERTKEGKRYFNFFASQVKILKKENSIRKFLSLK